LTYIHFQNILPQLWLVIPFTPIGRLYEMMIICLSAATHTHISVYYLDIHLFGYKSFGPRTLHRELVNIYGGVKCL